MRENHGVRKLPIAIFTVQITPTLVQHVLNVLEPLRIVEHQLKCAVEDRRHARATFVDALCHRVEHGRFGRHCVARYLRRDYRQHVHDAPIARRLEQRAAHGVI